VADGGPKAARVWASRDWAPRSAAQEKGEGQDDRGGSRTEKGRAGQRRGGHEPPDLGTEQQSPPVDQVGPRAGRPGEHHDGQTRGRLHQRPRQRGAVDQHHSAPTLCIQVPTFEANCAIESARKIG
jgi:hypothetical protein